MAEIASFEVVERTARRRIKLDPLWLALPGLGFLAIFLIVPTAQMLSVGFLDKATGAFTVSAFLRIWNGDQTDYGLNFTTEPQVLRVKLMTF